MTQLLLILIYGGFAALGFWITYWIIKKAVLHALIEYTQRATLGVSVVSANPLRVVVTEPVAGTEPPAQPSGD